MKIVNIIGGLGNQMFQYAFALALKQKHKNEQVLIDTEHFNGYHLHNGFELEKVFYTSAIDVANWKQISRVSRYVPNHKLSRIVRHFLPLRKSEFIDNIYEFNPAALEQKGDIYYEGYWQAYKYFEECKNIIKKQFVFRDIDETNLAISEEMMNFNSVSIHIRRGDYVNAKDFKNICTLDYYKHAIQLLKQSGKQYVFYIFSNDLEWCYENLKYLLQGHEIKFIEGNNGLNSYKDMYLMSSCKNMILANSSFSWWAAFLNRNANPIILIPTRWVNSTECMDIAPNEWIRVK